MVEILMGEVEGRSYKEGSGVQMVQKSREESDMKLIFEKLLEYSLFTFETQAPLFCYGDRVLLGLHCSFIKEIRWWNHSLLNDKWHY